MQVPFSKKEANDALTQDEKPAALSAFLNPPSRLINFNVKTQLLSPQQVSQKVASLLKPGPPFYSEVSSADLIECLSNGSLMRCDELRQQIQKDSQKKDKGWFKGVIASIQQQEDQSQPQQQKPWTGVGTVWSALDSLPSGTAVFAVPPVSPNGKIEAVSATKDDKGDDGLWSTIMFTCDLDGKNVELTKSCVIPTNVLDTHHYYNGNKSALFTAIGAGTTYKWDDWSNEQPANVSVASFLALYTTPTIEAWQWPSWVPYLGKKDDDKDAGKVSKPKPEGSKRVWVPSTTQVSIRASWWGYTIYIPQAVFPAFDSDVEQAEKIANLIHTVLTTILDKASSLPIPVALQAALLVLKAIAPSTSYISTFIGWSWKEIKSFNTGQGVELSATWLLPIALIPHTWDAAVAPPDKNGDGTPDGPPTTTPPSANVPQTGGDGDLNGDGTPSGTPSTNQPPANEPQTGEDGDQNGDGTPSGTPTTTQPPANEPQTGGDGDQSAPSQPTDGDAQPTTPAPEQPQPAEPTPSTPAPADPTVEDPKPEDPTAGEPKTEDPKPAPAEPTTPEIPAQPPQEHATLPDAPATEQPATPAPTPAPESPKDDDNTISGDPLGSGRLGLPAVGDAPAPTPAAENDGIEWQDQPAEIPAPQPSTPAAPTPVPAKPASTTETLESVAPVPVTSTDNTTEAKGSEKVKAGKRKLFGKITNRV
ncbi:uncharacterized protein FA14DRAFT_7322 [Meira miltonrushii]|uniref:Uncharacterized protein n=1 Tax=Meira miltonrushii TaxID=1280837 RepID=A0A316VH34_9BASI|nr:uncharacterized protein FA14DRAFT_7322 [Meira miltonrushii]PWN36830.1 hypothetical protein FA14DRAFT_7322 [Meira miltonrushii]